MMKYTKATNYALHTIAYLGLLPSGRAIAWPRWLFGKSDFHRQN